MLNRGMDKTIASVPKKREKKTMRQRMQERPYPYNLLGTVLGEDRPPEKYPSDIEDSVAFVMDQMPELERKVLTMTYAQRLTAREKGEQEGESIERIRQVLQRGQRMLRHPSRGRYLIYGLAEFKRKEEERNQEQRRREERRARRMQLLRESEESEGEPLCEIMDGRLRVDAILSRSKYAELKEMKLPVRAFNVLMRNGIRYTWQLCFAMPHEILGLQGAGIHTLTAIEQALASHELALDNGALSSDSRLWDYAEQRFTEVIAEMEKPD